VSQFVCSESVIRFELQIGMHCWSVVNLVIVKSTVFKYTQHRLNVLSLVGCELLQICSVCLHATAAFSRI